MKNAIVKLRENSPYMTNSDRKIAEYILLNTQTVAYMSIRELSQETFSSTSTIYRMCRNLGFQGYKDFRQSLLYDVAQRSAVLKTKTEVTWQTDSLEKLVEVVTEQNITSLRNTANLVDFQSLHKCVSLLSKAQSILLFSAGESLGVARDAHLRFLKCHKPCILSDEPRIQLLTARNSGPKDVGIVLSGSDEIEGLLECMRQLRKNGTPVIAVTRMGTAQIPDLADCTIYTAADSRSLMHDGASCWISQMNVIDILYTACVCGQGMNTERE